MAKDMQTPDQADLKDYVTFRLARTQNRLNAQASHILREHGDISLVEWRIISLIKSFEGFSMSQIAQEVDMDKGQLSRKVKAMVARGLIVSAPHETDQRRQVLKLTDAAEALHARVRPITGQRQRALTHDLSDTELTIFFDVLEKISKAAERRDFS